jgi:hypothetical protein
MGISPGLVRQGVLSEDKNTRLQSGVINRALIAETGVIPAGMQLIRDTFPFEVMDIKQSICEGVGGREEPIMKISGLIQNGDVENANGRFYGTQDVLIPAVRNIQEDVAARAVPGEFDHPCRLDTNFRLMTTSGWKEFREVRVGDRIWSRVAGSFVESRVNAIIDEPYDGPAYRIHNANISDSYTPGHRLLLEDRHGHQIYATIEDVYLNRKRYAHYRIPKTASRKVAQSSLYTIPGVEAAYAFKLKKPHLVNPLVMDARQFCLLLGLYLSKGNLNGRNGVCIAQKTPHGRKLVSEILDGVSNELQWTPCKRGFLTNDARLANWLRRLGGVADKFIPEDIKSLSDDCLEALIYSFAIGDGRMLRAEDRHSRSLSVKTDAAVVQKLDLGVYSRLAVSSVSERLIRDLHECLVKVGGAGRLSKVEPSNDYMFAGRAIRAVDKRTLHQLHVSRTRSVCLDPRFTIIEKIHHTGRIYCVSVDHGNFYMETGGCSFWTGNSDAKIHLDRLSHLMTKVWLEGKKVYGEAEVLHKLPCGAMLRGLFEHKVRVGISSRGVGDMEVMEHKGRDVYRVMPGYTFVTWDVVAEPSVHGAILNIQEGLNRRIKPIVQQKKLFSEDVYNDLLVKEINGYFGLDRKKVTVPVRLPSRRS